MATKQANKTTSSTNTAANSVPSIAVGLNDSVLVAADKAANDAAKPVDVRTRIAQLVAERETWQHGVYVKSNEQLYALLGKCYGFYFDLRGNDKEAKAARAVLESEISKKGYCFNEGTHMLTKIVKFVFDGIDRRRVSAYSLVLREALAQNKKADEIPAFITAGGGVEEIRRSKSGNAKTPAQKAALGKQAVAEKTLATFSSETLAVLAQSAGKSAGDELVAVIAQQADGSFVVRALVSSNTALNAALACAYSASKAVVKNDSAANDDKALDDLINEAA